MTVAELIEQLDKLDPTLRVAMCHDTYEGGYEDVTELKEFVMALDVHSEWYYGPHEDAEDSYSVEPHHVRVKAVRL